MTTRWLTPDAAAAYIGVRVHELPRLVRIGKVPTPSLHLGPRTPRYDRAALDAVFQSGAASGAVGMEVERAIQEIEAKSGPRRQAHARRRDGQGIPLPAAQAG